MSEPERDSSEILRDMLTDLAFHSDTSAEDQALAIELAFEKNELLEKSE